MRALSAQNLESLRATACIPSLAKAEVEAGVEDDVEDGVEDGFVVDIVFT